MLSRFVLVLMFTFALFVAANPAQAAFFWDSVADVGTVPGYNVDPVPFLTPDQETLIKFVDGGGWTTN